jgi:hypothetical protein
MTFFSGAINPSCIVDFSCLYVITDIPARANNMCVGAYCVANSHECSQLS